MNSIFKYSLLQYTHSQVLGEVFNVGILLFFSTKHKAVFKYSLERMSRLKYIYPDFDIKQINLYLKGFEAHAKKISRDVYHDFNKDIVEDTQAYIRQHFLQEDATTLQFSKVHSSVLYSEDIDKVVDNLLNDYFPKPTPVQNSDNLEQEPVTEKTERQFILEKIVSLDFDKNFDEKYYKIIADEYEEKFGKKIDHEYFYMVGRKVGHLLERILV